MTTHRKEAFLRTYDEEHAKTMKVLKAYPEDKLDLKPHPKLKNARELAWVFVMERYLGTKVWNDEFAAQGVPAGGKPPAAPEDWKELLKTLDKANADFRKLVASADDETLEGEVSFLNGPKSLAKISRHDWIWFLVHDQIHHRGQFSVYLRMAGGAVPSIYGPSGDEPWI